MSALALCIIGLSGALAIVIAVRHAYQLGFRHGLHRVSASRFLTLPLDFETRKRREHL